mmetsp:Transcript_8134/g.17615  ORF Transcript_8134/g.17615 Transcript_8134/m.17615 type:complete len:398 (+) Transcript_8134:258-1451(+)|eukprot:CAMPEP_0178497270 /NCGR_PEP_ID=MMETSP0696-20121128/14590_1 /TAXON_ID=265572 /ORGANISM="Extubocellulus spinifer, Strain CCMP396" /LENGTH=397 /DNA_ID=CAMNT_0020125667 /DNA_START=242 /DNA_END=1435 /DNA_ORIENTATION=-
MLRKTHVALAGKIFPTLSSAYASLGDGETFRDVSTSLHNSVDVADVVLLMFFGWASVPIARVIHRILFAIRGKTETRGFPAETFDQTYVFFVSDILSQIAKVALLVLGADCLDVIMESLGFDVAIRVDFGYVCARIAYTVWAAKQFAVMKHYLISKAVKAEQPDNLGRANLLDRCINFGIAMITGMFIMDLLDVEMGAGFTSVFALGGVGTIIVSLASKDLAEQLLSGIFLHISDKFYEGDLVKFGDALSGTVVEIGWFHTIIRLSNDTRMRIPNAQLANQTVTNLSRCNQCQVMTVLHFAYADMNKMSGLVRDIKEEVKAACPDLITDGSRPFRAHWTDVTTDRLQVTCDFHFNLKPFGDVYLDNRQRCLEAIGAAVTKNKHQVELAVPMMGKKQI